MKVDNASDWKMRHSLESTAITRCDVHSRCILGSESRNHSDLATTADLRHRSGESCQGGRVLTHIFIL
jgi:hypothetical protein